MFRRLVPALLCCLALAACGENPTAPGDTGLPPGAGTNAAPGVSGFRNADPDTFSAVPAMAADAGPWLTWIDGETTGTHVAISWGRTTLHRPVFRLGSAPGLLTNLVITNDLARRSHTMVCAGLLPGTAYYYRIDDVAGTVLLAERSFRTAPAAGEPFRFVFNSDTRPKTTSPLDDADARAVGAALAADPAAASAAFSVNAGDIVDRGRAQDWKAWLTTYWGGVLAQRPVLPAAGNHDYDEWNSSIGAQKSWFKDLFALPGAEWFYAATVGKSRFIVLDTGWTTLPKAMDLSFREGQLAFLDAELAAAREAKVAGTLDFLFVVIHKGIGTCGNHPQDDDIVALRAQIAERLAESGTDFVLQSHEHSWQRNSMDGVHYLVNGTGGSWREGENGERLLDKAPAGLVNHAFTKELGYALIDVNGRDVSLVHRSKDYVNLDAANYRLVDVTYNNPRGWSQVRMRFANSSTNGVPAWTKTEGRAMRALGTGSFRLTVPVLRDADGQYRLRASFNDGAGTTDDNFGADYVLVGDTHAVAGTVPPQLTVTITAPGDGTGVVNTRALAVSGTAAALEAGDSVTAVEVSLNGGAWTAATGTTAWSCEVRLSPGITNTLRARAVSAHPYTNTSAEVRVGHTIVPLLAIDGTREAAWNGAATASDASDNAGSVPLSSRDMDLTTLSVTNDGYYLYVGWALATNTMQASALWYLAIETGAAGGATNMAGFGQSSYSMRTTWGGVESPDLMAFFKYKSTANAGLNGFWVSQAGTGTAVHAWDAAGAVVSHVNQWAEARIPLADLGLADGQAIRCWLASSKSDNANRAFLDSVPRLGAEWPSGGSWTVPTTQPLVSAWLPYTLAGVQ